MIVYPATQDVYKQSIKEGLVDVFIDAGAAFSTPTCGPCSAAHGDPGAGEKPSQRRTGTLSQDGSPRAKCISPARPSPRIAVLGRIGRPEELK